MDSFDKSLFNSIICNITDNNTKQVLEQLHKFDPILFYDSTFKKWLELYTLIIDKLTKVNIHSLFKYMDVFSSRIFKYYFDQTNNDNIKSLICKYLDVVANYFKIQKVQLNSIVFQLLNTCLTFSMYNFGNIITDAQAKIVCGGDGLKSKKIEVRSDIDNLVYSNLAEYREQIANAEVMTYIPSSGQTEIIMDIPIITVAVSELIALQNTMCEISNQNNCKFVPFLMVCDDAVKSDN